MKYDNIPCQTKTVLLTNPKKESTMEINIIASTESFAKEYPLALSILMILIMIHFVLGITHGFFSVITIRKSITRLERGWTYTSQDSRDLFYTRASYSMLLILHSSLLLTAAILIGPWSLLLTVVTTILILWIDITGRNVISPYDRRWAPDIFNVVLMALIQFIIIVIVS